MMFGGLGLLRDVLNQSSDVEIRNAVLGFVNGCPGPMRNRLIGILGSVFSALSNPESVSDG